MLMVQIENEMGYLGPGQRPLAGSDRGNSTPLSRRNLCADCWPGARSFRRSWRTTSIRRAMHWREVFGEAANEVFMAWRYAAWVEFGRASREKREYPLPMYVNAQLPAFMEHPGEYPSGGPHPYYLAVYRAMAPAIDFYSPDIYWPEFEYWVKRYEILGNADFHSGSEDRQRPLERVVCLRSGQSVWRLSIRH